MTESFFEEVPNLPKDDPQSSERTGILHQSADPDEPFLNSLSVVQKIVLRKSASSWHSDAADLIQGIALRLLNWRKKNKDRSQDMSPEEWKSFAARTAYNEINRHHSNQNLLAEVPLEEALDYAASESLEGQSNAEESSLTLAAWQEICSMTLRQRRSLLLHSQKLYVYLLASGVTNEEIAAILEISLECWTQMKTHISLSDAKIAELIQKEDQRKRIGTSSKSIKKARVEARGKLRRVTDK